MYNIKFTGEFKRDMRLCKKRGYDKELILVMLNTGTHSDLFEKKSKK